MWPTMLGRLSKCFPTAESLSLYAWIEPKHTCTFRHIIHHAVKPNHEARPAQQGAMSDVYIQERGIWEHHASQSTLHPKQHVPPSLHMSHSRVVWGEILQQVQPIHPLVFWVV